MARNYSYNKYQYETSPRKLQPEYAPKKSPYVKKKSSVKKVTKKRARQKSNTLTVKQRQLLFYIVIGFTVLLAISYRNSQIDESFSAVQKLQSDLGVIQKENEQLRIGIENSSNLNYIEEQAMQQLGMQKLSSSQIVYVRLPKTDYIETNEISEDVNEGILQRIIGIFK
ncbi:MAG: hypothetical protein LBL91_00075 [Lachnospiraceae bacterium]|jgi:cell division protein FtsB|nr:hypothetical protein [Lachnospiraceae bacterium]